MNFALLGPTCAGKSTQAALLIDAFELQHVSPGQLLREHRDRRSAVGILTRRYVERGELVPDEVVAAIIEEAVVQTPPSQGLVFDGYPITEYQTRFLEELLQGHSRNLDALIYLPIPENVVFERAAKRIPKRLDDKPEILRYRLKTFERTTGPVLKRYAAAGRLIVIHADPAVDVVYQQIVSAVSELQANRLPQLSEADKAWVGNLLTAPKIPILSSPIPSLNLVMIGPPGSGKGTHAEFLCQFLGLPHIATGDLFRNHVTERTHLGKIAKSYLRHGELVPDDITEAMVRDRLSQADAMNGFVLDGFPRTVPQAHALDEILADAQRQLDGVIYLNVSDEETVYRIQGRWICSSCQASYHTEYRQPHTAGVCDRDGMPLIQRDDDNPETIRVRLKRFHGQTEPLIDRYRRRGLLVEVSGHGTVEAVQHAVLTVAQRWKTT